MRAQHGGLAFMPCAAEGFKYSNRWSRWQGLGSHHIVPQHAVSSGLVEEVCVEVQGTLPSAPMLRQLQYKVQLPYAGHSLHR